MSGSLRVRGLPLQAMLAEMAEEIASTVVESDQSDEIPLWEPLPGPQTMAYESDADELFYGGAAGGGKTDLLLGLAMTAHRSSVIFRREFTQFRGAEGMIERSRQLVGLRGRLHDGHVWRGLPGGRALEFAGVKTDSDRVKYQGRPHDLKGFDELPEFTEYVYRFLIGWLRTTRRGQRTRVVSTGNPPTTEEGQWVIKYWGPWLDSTHPNPAKPGELRWFLVKGGKDVEVPGPASGRWDRPPIWVEGEHGDPGQLVTPKSRTFIRASVEDNPHYMRTGYADQLNAMPEPLRSQLRYGNFTIGAGDDQWQVIPTAWVLAAQARWREVDGLGRALSCVGNDPSRGGKDEFVTALRYGNWVAPLVVNAATDAPDGPTGAAIVFRACGGDKTVPVQIDIIGGAGTSVFDHCLSLGLKAVALNGSEKSIAKDKTGKLGFVNQRAEWHWKMRELLDPSSGQDMALPPDAQIRSDLIAPRWRPTPRGIQVEEKDDIKARIGRSPDRGEAVMYACVTPTVAAKPQYRSVTW